MKIALMLFLLAVLFPLGGAMAFSGGVLFMAYLAGAVPAGEWVVFAGVAGGLIGGLGALVALEKIA